MEEGTYLKKFLEEFRQFAVRGNVMELAVAVIIGNAINAIVKSLVNDIFMPVIGLFIGRIDIKSLTLIIPSRLTGETALTIGYGTFLQSVLDFLTTAFCIFIILKLIKKLSAFSFNKEKGTDKKDDEPGLPKTEDLLAEIRDLLKEQAESKARSDLPDKLDKEH